MNFTELYELYCTKATTELKKSALHRYRNLVVLDSTHTLDERFGVLACSIPTFEGIIDMPDLVADIVLSTMESDDTYDTLPDDESDWLCNYVKELKMAAPDVYRRMVDLQLNNEHHTFPSVMPEEAIALRTLVAIVGAMNLLVCRSNMASDIEVIKEFLEKHMKAGRSLGEVTADAVLSQMMK